VSGPVRPPLTVAESDGSVTVRPCNDIVFDSADFLVTDNGTSARINNHPGAGATLTDTYIGFGSAANLLTGSANFTFTEESGGAGPQVLLTGDKPIMRFTDDTGATNYTMRFSQSGSSFYMAHEDSAGTDNGLFRLSSSYVAIQPTMTTRVGIGGYGESGIALKIEGTPDQVLQLVDTTDNYGLTLKAASDGSYIDFGDLDSATDSWMKFGAYSGANNIDTKARDFKIFSTAHSDIIEVDASAGSVGIGGAPDSGVERLEVVGDGSANPMVQLRSTESGASSSPHLTLYRNNTGTNNDDVGLLEFAWDNADDGKVVGAQIYSEIQTNTAGSESNRLRFYNRMAGSFREMMRFSNNGIEINAFEQDIDTKISSDGVDGLFTLNAGADIVSIGGAAITTLTQDPPFQVANQSGPASYRYIIPSTASPMTLTNNDLQSPLLVHDSASALTINLPLDGGVKGQYFQFVSTGGDITLVPSAVAGDTINGGTTSLTRSTDNEIYDCVCIANNTWILSNPA